MASFYADVLNRYVGSKIVEVCEDNTDPTDPIVGIVVQSSVGAKTIIWFFGDEEGNMPGVPKIQRIIEHVKLKLNIPHSE